MGQLPQDFLGGPGLCASCDEERTRLADSLTSSSVERSRTGILAEDLSRTCGNNEHEGQIWHETLGESLPAR
eukprot:757639-Hanusia_phi.AAC.3